MGDALYGTRDRRGDWKPLKPVRYPPVFVWPVRPMQFIKWFLGYPGFIVPWNLLYAATGVILWLFLTPPMETMRAFSVGWIAYLLARNAAIVLVFFGGFHLRLTFNEGKARHSNSTPDGLPRTVGHFCSAARPWIT